MGLRHFLQFSDLTTEEHEWIFQRAAVIKRKFKNYEKSRTAPRSSAGWWTW
ncbi:MAG: hypothetical protein K0S48_4047 [Ramlibacter sp.]|nr:hypothetical protein [Ramlibacter sp.]